MATSVENVEEPGIAESLIEAATQIQAVDRTVSAGSRTLASTFLTFLRCRCQDRSLARAFRGCSACSASAASAGGDGGGRSPEHPARNPHTSFAAVSNCRTIAIYEYSALECGSLLPFAA